MTDNEDAANELRTALDRTVGGRKAQIETIAAFLDAHTAKLRGELEDHRRHAKLCPQHFQNKDPWVRESALIAMTTERDHGREAAIHFSGLVAELQKDRFELIAAVKAMGHDVERCSRLNAELGKTEPCDCPYKILETIK